MVNNFPNTYFPSLKRVEQINEFYCGPAVLEMLVSFVGMEISQEEIVKGAEIKNKIEQYGMTIPEMAKAVARVAPQMQFWFKSFSTLGQLSEIVNIYHYPVGIEWQGVFLEDEDEDNGHYSVVTHIDTLNNKIMIADPYGKFAGVDRTFRVMEFENRWWDENEIKDPQTGRTSLVRDEKMMFIVTPKEVFFPELLNMNRG